MPEDTPDAGSVLDRITARLTVIGAIVTAVVGLNTTVTGCVDTDQQRHAAFRTAVDKEEQFWKGLFGDLNDALRKDLTSEERRAKLLLIRSMSDRPVPTFAEYRISLLGNDASEKRDANRYLASLRDRLRAAVLDRSIVGDAAGDAVQSAQFNNDQADRQRARDGAKVVGAAQAETVAAVRQDVASPANDTLSYDTQSLSVGLSTGWDVDVFWCVGQNEGSRYNLARAAATALAARANDKQPIASGVALGRVRLRALPLAQQQSGLYPVARNTIVFDDNAGEQDAASAIWKVVVGATQQRLAPAVSQTRSRWYISLFVCNAPAGPLPAALTPRQARPSTAPAA